MKFGIKPIKIKQQNISMPKFKQSKLKGFEFSISKEGRVRIPAKRRKEVYKKCKNKCVYSRCKVMANKGITLHIHHKNMRARDNRLANLELLCPNHHQIRHNQKFRKVISKDMLTGKTRKRLVNKKVKTKKKVKRKTTRKKSNLLDFKIPKFKF